MRSANNIAIGASFVAALLSAWLLASVVPAVRAEAERTRADNARRQTLSDAVASHNLARAVFARDYGEAQDLLDRYAEIGYATRALVTNADRVVVASVGAFPELKIGSRLPDILATGGRALRLTLRSEVYGELRIIASSDSAPQAVPLQWVQTLWVTAIALLVASVAVFVLLVLTRIQRD